MSITHESTSYVADVRERSIRTVLEALRAAPRRSRAELATLTGLSKPTVASALRALAGGGLARERGRTTGRRGPSATLYEPVPDAVLVLGLDIGAHHVRGVLADLDCLVLDEADVALAQPDVEHVLAAVRQLRARLDRPNLELAVVGSPGVVDPRTARIRSSPNITGWEGSPAELLLRDALGLTTTVENDVNLAALGELARGGGRGHGSFAYLNVGSGLGAGLVLDGHLYRGRHGAAGEIAYLSASPTSPPPGEMSRGPMEHHLSHDAVVRTARELDPDAPDDPRELFRLARNGSPLGRQVVAATVEALSACIASLTAVVDLDLVLLGGGIGSQADLLLEPVRVATAQRVPYAPTIRCGELGDHATLIGAVSLGAQRALAAVVARCLARSAGGGLGSPAVMSRDLAVADSRRSSR